MLSPGTAALDRTQKLPLYARERVAPAWLVDPIERTPESFRRDGAHWTLLGAGRGAAQVQSEPFESYTLDLASLWAR